MRSFKFLSMVPIFVLLSASTFAANLKNTSCMWVGAGGGYLQASVTYSLGFQNGGDRDYNLSISPLMINEIPGQHTNVSIASMAIDLTGGTPVRPNCKVDITPAEMTTPGKTNFTFSISGCDTQNFLIEDPLNFTCELGLNGG